MKLFDVPVKCLDTAVSSSYRRDSRKNDAALACCFVKWFLGNSFSFWKVSKFIRLCCVDDWNVCKRLIWVGVVVGGLIRWIIQWKRPNNFVCANIERRTKLRLFCLISGHCVCVRLDVRVRARALCRQFWKSIRLFHWNVVDCVSMWRYENR